MRGVNLKNSVQTEAGNVYFPGWMWLDDELADQLEKLDAEASATAQIQTGPDFWFPEMPDANESATWQAAEVGDKVHISKLTWDIGLVRFYQPEKHENSPSYCDTPVSTFMSYKRWLPWYVRIE